MKSKLKLLILSLCLIGGLTPAQAERTHSKAWYAGTLTTPLWPGSSFKYFQEQHLRLADSPYVFNQFLLLSGLGYQFNEKIALYLGPGWIINKTVIGGLWIEERRFWQQLNWVLHDTSKWILHSRTRLEERKQAGFGLMGIRFRERLWLRLPIAEGSQYAFSCFNEIFLNLTHPLWTSPYLYEQNRAFFGISWRFSKSFMIDVGYLNQYLHSIVDQIDNVALINVTISQ